MRHFGSLFFPPHKEFLRSLSYNYEAAAKRVLQWAASDEKATADYLASFMLRLSEEVNLTDPYLSARSPDSPFAQQLPSVALVSVRNVFRMLWKRPTLMTQVYRHPDFRAAFRYDPNHPLELEHITEVVVGLHLFVPRGLSDEVDPLVPPEAVEAHHERQRRHSEWRAEQQRKERERIEQRRAERKRERARKHARRQEEARRRGAFRKKMRQLTKPEQIAQMGLRDDVPLTTFPLVPDDITVEDLEQVPFEARSALLERAEALAEPFEHWSPPWERLVDRIYETFTTSGSDEGE